MINTNLIEKFVDFNTYCKKCVYKNENETDPNSACYECLFSPVNGYSKKPICFKEDNQ